LDENLLIATWKIRGLTSLTRKWTAGDADSPKRDLRGLLAIGEIIRRFDVIAVQEVKGDLRDLIKWLGPDWADCTNAWSQNLIAMGDFNIDRNNDPLWQAFT
jgi:endonuclease/exonuclease/phosphatase family metal-dependent hydrolase